MLPNDKNNLSENNKKFLKEYLEKLEKEGKQWM